MPGIPPRPERYLHRLAAGRGHVSPLRPVEDAAEAKGIGGARSPAWSRPNMTAGRAARPAPGQLSRSVCAVTVPWRVAGSDLATGLFHAAEVPWARLADELARLGRTNALCPRASGTDISGDPPAVPSDADTPPDWTLETNSGEPCYSNTRRRHDGGVGLKTTAVPGRAARSCLTEGDAKSDLGH